MNPVAGKGNAVKQIPRITEDLDKAGIPFKLVETTRPGDGISLAEEACNDSYRGIIAAGGDGTGNEVINGMMAAVKAGKNIPPFGMLCVGRGNDMAYGAGIPSNVEEGCRLLAEPRFKPMDVGLVTGGDYPEGRYFGNGIGIGFDTIVGLEAAKMTHVHGFLAYVYGAIRTLVRNPEPPLLEMSFDGEVRKKKSPQLSIMNGTRMGGTFFMAPDAENDDGFFDLCMADDVSRGKLLAIIVRYTKGTQAESPYIWTRRTSEIVIRALEGGLVVHADGETICTDGKELRVQCFKHSLTSICGKGHVQSEDE